MSTPPIVESLLQVALRRQLIARDRSGSLRDQLNEAGTPTEVREDLECMHEPETKVLAELLCDDDLLLTAPYVRHACLGQGRLGVTWLGSAPDGRRVAIKVIHAHRLAPGAAVELLIRDLKPWLDAELHYLVPYRAAFAAADGRAVLVQDYIPGRDLAQRAQIKGPMLEARALMTLRQMTKALGELQIMRGLHGLIHPGNVILDDDHRAHLNDYGLVFGNTLQALRPGFTPGELQLNAWSAPELLAPNPRLLAASDIYSLGCVGYWLLTSTHPFSGASAQQAAQHRGGARPDVRNLAADTSEITAKTILKCMQVDPARRYPSVSDLGRSLQRNLNRLLPDEHETGPYGGQGDSVSLSLSLDDHGIPTTEVDPDASALAPRSRGSHTASPHVSTAPDRTEAPPVAKPLPGKPDLKLADD